MWEEDGLDVNISQPFLRESLPRIDTEGKKVLQNFLNRHERIKNPTPDRVYGVADDAFTEEENTVNNMYNKSPAWLPASTTLASSSSLGEIRAWRKLRRNARAAARQQSTQLVKYVLLLEKTLCKMELTLPASFTLLQSRRRSHISRYIGRRSSGRGPHSICITSRLIPLEKSRKSLKCAVT